MEDNNEAVKSARELGHAAGCKPFYAAVKGPHPKFATTEEQQAYDAGFQRGLVDYSFRTNLSD
jgi:hypothetical protein